MVSRGNSIKAEGNEDDLAVFKKKVERMIDHIERYGKLNEDNIEAIVLTEEGKGGSDRQEKDKQLGNIIVYGNNGLVVRARTDNQLLMVKESEKNDIVFAIGPAGTGKTYTAVALAVRALKEKNVKKIILTRPAVEAGESLGFLPGDLKEKIDPYLRPLYDALDDMIPADKLTYYMENRVIEVAPLAFMRGRTLDHAYIILDEAQNCSDMQLKMFLTRIGANSKVIITGDPTQIDLPPKVKSGLGTAIRILRPVEGISTILLDESDVVRHRLVKEIIKAYNKLSESQKREEEE
jgi:phosphate starvation-inducible PhoH-like protein